MTTPGGVPNLPPGALTLDTLAASTQDMSGPAMKSRAAARFPSIMDSSTGLSPASDLTPFGILTSIWAGVNSLIAQSDPADIQGPEDLPELFLEFIEGLPVVGQLVGLLEAILGTYDGDDETLLTVQRLFQVLWSLLADLNPLDPGFNPLGAWTKIWQLLIAPGGLAVSSSDVLGATLPLTIPFTVGGSNSPVRQWFIDIPQAIRDILQNIINAFKKVDPTGVTGLFGDLMLQGFDMFLGIFNRGQTNSSSIAALENAVFGLDGVGITIDFSGPDADLEDLGWTTYTYGGAGCVMSQKDDYAYMRGLAPSDATLIMVLDDPAAKLSSNIQSRTDFLREKIASSGSTAEWGALRVNAAIDESDLSGVYWRAASGGSGGTLNLGIQIDGVSTDLVSIPGVDDGEVSLDGLTFAPQDRIDLVVGDPDPTLDPVADYDQKFWRWRLWHNTTLVMDYVFNPESWDADAANLLDETTYNCPSFAMTADFVFLFVPFMVPPTTVERLVLTVPAVEAA